MAKESAHTHLLLGKEQDTGPRTRTGCGLTADDCRRGGYFYGRRAGVTCPDCQRKAQQIAAMRGD